MSTTTTATTAVSIRTNEQTVKIPRQAGWYEPTDNLKQCIRHHIDMRVDARDVARVIENGEVAYVDDKPAPNGLSKGRPELTFRGEARNGYQIEVDVSPAGALVGPLGELGSAVMDGICQMQILRVRRAYQPYTEPIDAQNHKEEEEEGKEGDGRAMAAGEPWPVPE